MNFKNIPLLVAAIAFSCTATVVLAKPASKSATSTYYSHGKQVGKSVTHGNTTTYYSRGKATGKSIRR